ncbi:MAG TPA: hypothetical protein PLK28_13270 [Candidatus Rifleibacterium sp.]|jgi:hypothetical protein|nr:hypothetical protein [Candidatus Rifleibacterium sp.]
MEKLEFTIQVQEPGKSGKSALAQAGAQDDIFVRLAFSFFWLFFWLLCLYLCFTWSPFLILPVVLLDAVYTVNKYSWRF